MPRLGGAYCFGHVRSQRKSVDWRTMGPALGGAFECYAHISSFSFTFHCKERRWIASGHIEGKIYVRHTMKKKRKIMFLVNFYFCPRIIINFEFRPDYFILYHFWILRRNFIFSNGLLVTSSYWSSLQACKSRCVHEEVRKRCNCYRHGARKFLPRQVADTVGPCVTDKSKHWLCLSHKAVLFLPPRSPIPAQWSHTCLRGPMTAPQSSTCPRSPNTCLP